MLKPWNCIRWLVRISGRTFHVRRLAASTILLIWSTLFSFNGYGYPTMLDESRWVGLSVGLLKVGRCAFCSREQCRSWGMTFFFSAVYLQYHINRIARWKKTGELQ